MAENQILIEDAQIRFRNFKGAEGQYNREGDRNFAVFLDEGIAKELEEDGWNVKRLKPLEDADPNTPPQAYLQVSVAYKNRPPKIFMISSRGRTPIDEDLVETLDWIDIKTADLIINPYEWSVNGKSGIKAYLKSLYVTVDEDALDLKYADVPDAQENVDPEPF